LLSTTRNGTSWILSWQHG